MQYLGFVTYAQTTSTATIGLSGWTTPGAARMFGITALTLNSPFATNDPSSPFYNQPVPFSSPAPLGPYYSCQEYLDSDATGTFFIDAGLTSQPTVSTAVPFQRYLADASYDYVAGRGYDPTTGIAVQVLSTRRADFIAVYKDVDVIEMPSSYKYGGWLMLAARYRVLASDVGADSEDTAGRAEYLAANDACVPGQSIGDLVAFWSPDATFSEVVGPIPLVSSMGGVKDPLYASDALAAQPGFRSWLGVPGGVLYGDDLYLYYSVRPDVDERTHRPYLGVADWLEPAIAAFDDGVFGSVSEIIAKTYVARIPLATLEALLDDPPDEQEWDKAHDWPEIELARPVAVLASGAIPRWDRGRSAPVAATRAVERHAPG